MATSRHHAENQDTAEHSTAKTAASTARARRFYLGLFCHGSHDAAVCLVNESGQVVFAAEEERFNRRKFSAEFPAEALQAGLRQLDIKIDQITAAGFAWNPRRAWHHIAWHLLRNLPHAHRFLYRKKQNTGSRWRKLQAMLSVEQKLRERGFRGRFQFFDHHLCHAASSFYASGFSEATCLVADGNGEFATTAIYKADTDGLNLLWQRFYPHSLGHFYATVTQYLGFKPLHDEFKVMGLAAYAHDKLKPGYQNAMAKILRLTGKKSVFALNTSWFQFQRGSNTMFSKHWVKKFGLERQPGEPLLEHHRQLAAAAQKRLETVMLSLARFAAKQNPGSKNLCLAGGVGLNCVNNQNLATAGIFEHCYFQPASHDAGTALGAAYLLFRQYHPQLSSQPVKNYYLGNGTAAAKLNRDTLNTLYTLAQALADRKVIAWYQGRMEFGPRALGARSILANPCHTETRTLINSIIKKREVFRPFAPVVCADDAARFFDLAEPSPNMMRTVPVREPFREKLQAVTHIDGSARVQTVDYATNPELYLLLKLFAEYSGMPILLNTSLNQFFEPIIANERDAWRIYSDTKIDMLYLNGILHTKSESASVQNSADKNTATTTAANGLIPTLETNFSANNHQSGTVF